MIEAASLVKRYGTLEAVKGVSFFIGGGEIVGLLGPNGAGKTSLMRLLTCYHFPDSGTARVGAHDVALEPHRVRQLVGYLPESSPLYPDMKVGEYLGFIADARDLRGSLRRQRIDWRFFHGTSVSCPGATASGRDWPRRSCTTRRSWCSTSLLRGWTPIRSRKSGR
jgi:ABC-type multidrug transport system ATPase subunit